VALKCGNLNAAKLDLGTFVLGVEVVIQQRHLLGQVMFTVAVKLHGVVPNNQFSTSPTIRMHAQEVKTDI
jgi:hypothetical protein